jgi:ABC-type Fe3+/spermidine/putrescine transport system ATPase subunit
MRASAVSLEIREARVSYGANRVLNCASLSAAGGERTALQGASVCGKTTLSRAIGTD